MLTKIILTICHVNLRNKKCNLISFSNMLLTEALAGLIVIAANTEMKVRC